jgi:hypothetical protein
MVYRVIRVGLSNMAGETIETAEGNEQHVGYGRAFERDCNGRVERVDRMN